jgi:peptide/nickel transport system substrate-binding protein
VKKALLVLVICAVCSLIITGCGTDTNTNTTPAPTPISTSKTTTPLTSAVTNNLSPTVASKTSPQPGIATPVAPIASPSTSGASSKSGGVLRWVEAIGPTSPIGLPAECSGPSGLTPQISLQTLLREQLDGSVKTGLASSYDIVADAAKPSITFHLQKGVKFSDGSDFNATAVKWNLDSINASKLYVSTASNWKSIEVINDNTIRVNLNVWQNTVIPGFCNLLSYQISPAAFEKNGIDWIRWHLVGTGPFVQTDFQRDVSLTAARNLNYWESGKPYLDGFKYFFVSDELTRTALFKSGGADVLQTNGNGRIANELKADGYNIVTQLNGPNVLVMDSANPSSPWGNLKVRQAAEYALDKESIAKTFGFGWWEATNQFSITTSQAYDPTIAARKYDVAKAKQLLSEAGYPAGFKTTIIASPLQLNRDVVLAVQSQLGKVGIQAEVQFPENAKWTEISSNTWNNALLYTSIFTRGNQNETFSYFMGTPATTWKSALRPTNWKETLDASKAASEQDPVVLKKLENMIFDNVICIPIASSTSLWAMTDKVHDTGAGTRGQSNWIEPQNSWLSK